MCITLKGELVLKARVERRLETGKACYLLQGQSSQGL